MGKVNCWESKKCGREPGGAKVKELGVCPVFNDNSANNLNGGKQGGRICWAVTGTYCGGKVQGTFAQKKLTCLSCEFYRQVKMEEGADFSLLKPGQKHAV